MALYDFDAQLRELFGYIEPDEKQRRAVVLIRTALANAARVILNETKSCPDQLAAIQLLRQACFMANCAVVKPHGGAIQNFTTRPLANNHAD